MNLFKSILLFILSIQEKALTKNLNKTLGVKINSKRKKYFHNGCNLSIDSLAESEKLKMEEELALILKTANYDPNEVIKYIKSHNTNVFYIKNAKSLHAIGEDIGFIYPQKGIKALSISLLTTKKITFKTPECFILKKENTNIYHFIYHFYNWYAYKHNIIGLDSESQALLNKYLLSPSEEDFSKLQLAEIYKLKDAIKQDKSAIEFVLKLCQQYETSQKAFEKVKNNGANI